MKYVRDHAGRMVNDTKVAKLEKKVARLEKALIAARLELSAARPCLMCGKTTAEGCKADVSPYVCDQAWKPYQS